MYLGMCIHIHVCMRTNTHMSMYIYSVKDAYKSWGMLGNPLSHSLTLIFDTILQSVSCYFVEEVPVTLFVSVFLMVCWIFVFAFSDTILVCPWNQTNVGLVELVRKCFLIFIFGRAWEVFVLVLPCIIGPFCGEVLRISVLVHYVYILVHYILLLIPFSWFCNVCSEVFFLPASVWGLVKAGHWCLCEARRA